MSQSKNNKNGIQKIVNIRNRRAAFDYFFLENYTAGIVLKGTEIKSIRQGKVTMTDSFCLLMDGELFVRNMDISPYERGNIHNHQSKADRKLLLKKRELGKIERALQDVGTTLVPVRIFINDKGLAKVEIAVAKGKKLYDKRETIKERDQKRDIERY
ncbi:SsrA-binding protein SmpB [Hugenholtzia roseola]|uniref:SsrA-binding protein SmpB n=1 Tax=Hugenholtzia roseola TaxID=1002 RepID=UPI0003F7432F|nr:SsrA-binding protein SmpB [Hugenholtzia roseola]